MVDTRPGCSRGPRAPSSVVTDTPLPAANEFAQRVSAALSQARDSLAAAQARIKRNADELRRELTFSVGDEVLLSSKNIRLKTAGTRKLLPKFLGPYTVLKRIRNLAYQLELPLELKQLHPVFHVSLLRPWDPDSGQLPPPAPTIIDGEIEFDVERILEHRDRKVSDKGRRTKREFLVKWR